MVTTGTLVIFVKTPRLGAVKRRLARDIGPIAAVRFYRTCLRTVIGRLSPGQAWRSCLAVTPDRDIARRGFWNTPIDRFPQGTGDLGRRMGLAFRLGGPGPVVIVGSDIPGIERRHIAEAFRRLRHHDAVFGPSPDGGYWLVGLRGPYHARNAFRNVRWSSPSAFSDTRRNLPATARIFLLEALEDVDDGRSWRRWRASASPPTSR